MRLARLCLDLACTCPCLDRRTAATKANAWISVESTQSIIIYRCCVCVIQQSCSGRAPCCKSRVSPVELEQREYPRAGDLFRAAALLPLANLCPPPPRLPQSPPCLCSLHVRCSCLRTSAIEAHKHVPGQCCQVSLFLTVHAESSGAERL